MSRHFERLRERVDCLIHGHRDLSRAPAYGVILSGSTEKELRYCSACGSPVWVAVSPDQRLPPSWSGTGLAGA
jgi:hypothetical protein